MMSKIITFFTVALFVILFPSSVSAATFYVSPNGNDSNSGSSSSPFRTYNKAQLAASSGDTIYMLAGTYPGTLQVTKSGLNIIGQNAVIDGTGKHKAIEISANDIIMDGFEAKHSESHVVYIVGKNITFKNSYIHDGIYENRNSSTGLPRNTGWGSGLSIKHDVQNGVERIAENITIDNVKVERVYGEGIDMYGVRNVSITNSVVIDAYAVGFYIDNSHDITLEKNFAYCSGDNRFRRDGDVMTAYSMALERLERWYPSVNWGARLYNIRIVNNISYGCKGMRMWGSELPSGTQNNGLRNALIAHNSFLAGPSNKVSLWMEDLNDNSNIRILNNLFYSSADSPTGGIMQGNLTNVNFTTSNITPSAMKPDAGKNRGINLVNEVGYDFAGNQRDSVPDVGAWEIDAQSTARPTEVAGPTLSALLGDLNGDGIVDSQDYQIFLSDYGKTDTVSDINRDGKVNIFDYNLLVANFGVSI